MLHNDKFQMFGIHLQMAKTSIKAESVEKNALRC